MSIVTFNVTAGVGHIFINRPERRNAINHTALNELSEAVAAARSSELRALVVSGADNQFCSGADLKELEDLEFTRALREVLDAVVALEFPVIAAISGTCFGLGMQLAMACDIRLATEDARFAVPVAKLGLMVDHWTVQRLALYAGHSTARQMLLTARPIAASRAHQIGLVQELVTVDDSDSPGDASLQSADDLAGEIAKLAPLALRGSKLGLDLLERNADQIDPSASYRAAFEAAWGSDDLMEGQLAFKEHRPPSFEGR